MPDSVIDHPPHYGGEDNPYEAIKVIEAWQLGFCLGNCVKYICRAGKKFTPVETVPEDVPRSTVQRAQMIEDLKKAQWYLQHEIERLSRVEEA